MDTPQYQFPRNYAAEPYSGVTFELELFTRVLSGLCANAAMCGVSFTDTVSLAENITAQALVRLRELKGFEPSGD